MATSYQFYTWPAINATSSSPSTGPTGSAAPAQATEVGGVDSGGVLRALKTDTSGVLQVDIVSSTLTPLVTSDLADGSVTGGAAGTKSILTGGQYNTSFPSLTNTQQAALQIDSSARLILSPITNSSVIKAQLQTNSGSAINFGQAVMASSLPVAIASDQSAIPASQSGTWNINNISGTVSLPTGASTEATLAKLPIAQSTALGTNFGTMIQGSVTTAAPIYTTGNINPLSLTTAGALRVDASGTTQPISGTVTANQGTSPWVENVSQFGGSNVVTGTGASGSGIPRVTISNDSSLAANQSVNMNQVGGSSVTLGQKASTSSIPVVLASDQSAISGRSSANAPIQNIYSSTNITTSAYVQLVASTSNNINYIDIFDSSGQAMIFAVGGSGSEVIQAYIAPGGAQIPLKIPSGSRVAYKALSSNATAGYLIMSFYQ